MDFFFKVLNPHGKDKSTFQQVGDPPAKNVSLHHFLRTYTKTNSSEKMFMTLPLDDIFPNRTLKPNPWKENKNQYSIINQKSKFFSHILAMEFWLGIKRKEWQMCGIAWIKKISHVTPFLCNFQERQINRDGKKSNDRMGVGWAIRD